MRTQKTNEVISLDDLQPRVDRVPRLYFGGMSGCVSVMIVQPLDLLKVNMQTQQGKTSLFEMARFIAERNGIRGFYNGMSAALLRQMTYTLTRFGVYEEGKRLVPLDTFWKKVAMAALGGVIAGFVGTPADLINVRMQNDVTLPTHLRRNYKNVFHGLYSVVKHEGPLRLFNGLPAVALRGGCINVGQLACYEQLKDAYMEHVRAKDDLITHVSVSACSAIIGATLTHPLDVVKTRTMNARPGEFRNLWEVVTQTAAQGPRAFTRGYVSSLIRMVPSTTITLVVFEELRQRFGIDPPRKHVLLSGKEPA